MNKSKNQSKKESAPSEAVRLAAFHGSATNTNWGYVQELEARCNALTSACKAARNALVDVQDGYQELFDVMPVAWQTYDNIVETALEEVEAALRAQFLPQQIGDTPDRVTGCGSTQEAAQ